MAFIQKSRVDGQHKVNSVLAEKNCLLSHCDGEVFPVWRSRDSCSGL